MLLAAVLSALITAATFASSGSAAEPGVAAGKKVCAGSGASASALSIARLGFWDDDDEFPIRTFLTGRLAGPPTEWALVTGFHWASKLTGLEKVLPQTKEAKILEQLNRISEQLKDINTRLVDLGANVQKLLTEGRETAFRQAMVPICNIANEQLNLYEQRYEPFIEATADLGAILSGPTPGLAKQEGENGAPSPEERAKKLRQKFIDYYDNNANALETGIDNLHGALVPGEENNPVLQALGKVRMRKRFVTRADSERLLALYAALAEVRALASWMAVEYWSSQPENPKGLRNVVQNFFADSSQEKANLPRPIPPGVVVDVGKVNGDSADQRPMWFAPTAKDLGWLPGTVLGQRFGVIEIDEAGQEARALNQRDGFGRGWGVPTSKQFRALISEGCSADPKKPRDWKQGEGEGACRNAVTPGSTVAAYLQDINTDKTWQQLFCQSLKNSKCPPGAGPTTPGSPPHAFVWTSDLDRQRMVCGSYNMSYPVGDRVEKARHSFTYTGFPTLADGPRLQAFPRYPPTAPGARHSRDLDEVEHLEVCDTYIYRLAMGNPSAGVPRSHSVEGVLLATRYSGKDDRSESGRVDFMAQPVASAPALRLAATCAGQEATIAGTRGDDRIRGTSGRDVIVAGPGDDVVRALGGRDLVCGGGGEDLLIGGRGNDTLRGGRGDDVLRGGPGRDRQLG